MDNYIDCVYKKNNNHNNSSAKNDTVIKMIMWILIIMIINPPEKQLYKWKTQHDNGHWNWKEKVKMWEILHLSWSTIPGMDR